MKLPAFKNVFLLIFCMAVICYFALSSVFEDIQAIFPIFFSGSATQGNPLNIFNYTTHFLLAEVYMKLYILQGKCPWFELVMYAYVVVSLFVVLKVMLERNNSRVVKGLVLITCLFFFSELTVVFQYTRIAFALGISSTLLWTHKSSNKRFYYLFSSLLFLIALLTRWEVGLFVVLIQWLLIAVNPQLITKPAVWLNTLFFAMVFGYISYERATATGYTEILQQELGYQLERGNIVSLSAMTTAVDSVKYISVLNLISDPDYITLGFIKGILREDLYKGLSKELVFRCLSVLTDIAAQAIGFLLIYGLLLTVVLTQQFKRNRTLFWRLVLFNTTVVALEFIITYYIKMESRQFNPTLIFMCLLLLLWLDFSALKNSTAILVTFISFLVCGLIIQYKLQQEYVIDLKNTTENNNVFRQIVVEKCGHKILVPDLRFSQSMIGYIRPIQYPDYSAFHRLYLFDFDVLYLEKNYNGYLHKECNCNAGSYTELMDFFVSKKDSVVWVSTPQRISAIIDYCHTVRHKDYQFSIVDSVQGGGAKAFIYSMD